MLRALFILSLAAIAGPGTPTASAQDQRADPDFDTKVAAPTYTSGIRPCCSTRRTTISTPPANCTSPSPTWSATTATA